MWIKLGNDQLNLDHILRVRFVKAWKNGREEWLAELECLIKGEIQVFARYRDPEASILRMALERNQRVMADLAPAEEVPALATNTIPEL